MKEFLVGFTMFCCFNCIAQQKTDPPYTRTPYRPKIAEFTISHLFEYQTHSHSETLGNSETEIERDQQIKARLGIPIILKRNLVVGTQFKFDYQNFRTDPEGHLPSELYDYLQAAKFKSFGGRVFVQARLSEKKRLSVIASGEIKSDQLVWNPYTSKYFLNVNYKVEKNEHVTIGGGFASSYTLGIPQIYPVFYYENNFARRWTLDLALPKLIAVRLEANPKFFITFKSELKGWRYALHNAELYESRRLTLRKADIRLGVNLEHEIHDWLWAGMDLGFSKNIRHYLVETGEHRKDAISELQSTTSPYLNFSIFIVPPKKIYDRSR